MNLLNEHDAERVAGGQGRPRNAIVAIPELPPGMPYPGPSVESA